MPPPSNGPKVPHQEEEEEEEEEVEVLGRPAWAHPRAASTASPKTSMAIEATACCPTASASTLHRHTSLSSKPRALLLPEVRWGAFLFTPLTQATPRSFLPGALAPSLSLFCNSLFPHSFNRRVGSPSRRGPRGPGNDTYCSRLPPQQQHPFDGASSTHTHYQPPGKTNLSAAGAPTPGTHAAACPTRAK